jgi:TP901 family phage tail tape measure protein
VSDRSVLVRLTANVAGLQAGMAQARRSVQDTSREISSAAAKNKQEFTQLGLAAGAAGAAIAVGLAKAVGAAADFDREMSAVAAVAGATAQEMDQLREAAIRAGADTSFSAGQSATAIAELTRAGVAVSDVLGGALAGALDLAAAGGLDLANASTIAAQAMNLFNLEGSDVSRVADALAAGANKSAADVATLGDALRQGGLLAAQTGLSLEDTVGALALFADNALVGSDAGTSMKAALTALTPTSQEAARLMEELGFSAFDASGEFIGLEALAGELQTSFGGLSTEQRNAAMSTIFGSDAVRAANVLMGAGAAGVAEYTAAVTDQGAAAEMAGVMLDNWRGDLEELGGSFETLQIEYGENVQGILRATTQLGTSVVNSLADIPEPMQNVALGFGGLTSAAGLAAGGFLLAAPRIADTKEAFDKLSTSMPRTIAGFRQVGSLLTGPWGIALAAATVGVGLFLNEQRQANDRIADSTVLLDENTGALLQNSTHTRAAQLVDDGRAATAERLGVSLATLTAASMGSSDAQDQMAARIGDTVAAMEAELSLLVPGTIAFDQQAAAIERTRNQADSLTGSVVQQSADLAEQQRQTAAAAEAQRELQNSALGLGIAFEDLRNDQYQTLGATDGWATSLLAANTAAQTTATGISGLAVTFGQTREAIDAQLESFAGYANNLGIYQSALGEANAAVRAWGQAQAEETEDATDSWETFATEMSYSTDVYLQSLRDQVTDQQEWADLIAEAQRRGLDNIAAEIIAAGPTHNDLYADLLLDQPLERAEEAERLLEAQTVSTILAMAQAVNTGGLDFIDAYGTVGGDAVAAIAEQLGLSTAEVAAALDDADVVAKERGALLEATFDQMGADSTAALALRLRDGVTQAAGIAIGYADALAGGVNPLLEALGAQGIPIQGVGGRPGGLTIGLNAGGPVDGFDPPAVLVAGDYLKGTP